MANPSVTYTFVNGTTIQAAEVNQNFTDIISGLTDGTKDLTISALTVGGTATLNGNIVLGNASVDTLTQNGRWINDVVPNADGSYDLGTAALSFAEIHLNNGVTDGGSIYFNGGTTSFIKSSADGLSLLVGGFTAFGSGLKNICQAWARFNGTTATVVDSVNVTSVTRNSAGDYTVNLSITMTNTNYLVLVTCSDDANTLRVGHGQGSTTSAAFVRVYSSTSTKADSAIINVAIFGQQV